MKRETIIKTTRKSDKKEITLKNSVKRGFLKFKKKFRTGLSRKKKEMSKARTPAIANERSPFLKIIHRKSNRKIKSYCSTRAFSKSRLTIVDLFAKREARPQKHFASSDSPASIAIAAEVAYISEEAS